MPPNLREALTTRLGPLPAWAWGLMLGGAIVAWRVLRDRGAEPVEEAEPGAGELDEFGNEIVTGTATGYGDFTLTPSPMGGGTFAVAPAVTQPGEQEPVDGEDEGFASNFEWSQAAITWLADPDGGGLPGVVANDAISRWLQGSPLSDQQVAAVNAAIRQLGPPPDSAPSIIRQPSPPAAQAPSTPAVRPPGRPGNLRFGPASATSVNVGWNPPTETGGANITQYQVQRESARAPGVWRNVGGNIRGAATTAATGTSMPVTANTRWRFRVRARNRAGWGPYAVSAYVRTPEARQAPQQPQAPQTPQQQPQQPQRPPQQPQRPQQRPLPSAPRNVRGTASTATRGHVRIIWQAPARGAPFTAYEAYLHRGGNPIRLPITGTSQADASGLIPGNRYAFQVRARNARGWGPFATIRVTAR